MKNRKRKKSKNSKINIKNFFKKYIIITVASFMYAIAISLFIDPNNMAPGGITGISIILSRFVGINTGTLIMLINIPILIFSVIKFGIRFTISTIYATGLISLFTNILSPLGGATSDRLLAALFGGALIATALGIIFRVGATTGGMDIIVKALRLRLPHMKTGVLFFIMDAIVVTMSGIFFRDIDAALYSAISVVCTSVIMDVVLYGKDEAKLIYIISNKCDDITARLLEELDVGVTHINGQGAFSKTEKTVIMCAVKKSVSPKVETIVREVDTDSFMIITSAMEIFGEGYKSYFSERM